MSPGAVVGAGSRRPRWCSHPTGSGAGGQCLGPGSGQLALGGKEKRGWEDQWREGCQSTIQCLPVERVLVGLQQATDLLCHNINE